MNNTDITNHFYLNKKQYDGFIEISIISKDKDSLKKIMESIDFNINCNHYQLEGFPIDYNNDTATRKIFFRKTLPQ